MLIGGGIGSTSGGIKLLRAYILYKGIKWEIRRAFLPQHTVNEPHIWQGERREVLNDHLMRQVFVFMAAFTLVYLFGVGMMLAYGYGLRDSVFEVASAIGTAGLSTGVTQPTMPEALLWSQSIVMLLGRLEFYAVFIGLTKLFSDGYNMLKHSFSKP
jgi:trk system potassium uptake protein TrkH